VIKKSPYLYIVGRGVTHEKKW